MVEEGVLENPKVDAIFGAHVFPFLPTGKVGIYEREGLAATDRFTIHVLGKGGHAAAPHISKDPILAAGHLITQIHAIVSRNINPLDSAVVTIGKVSGGTTFNIIPDEVELLGTVRSLNPQVWPSFWGWPGSFHPFGIRWRETSNGSSSRPKKEEEGGESWWRKGFWRTLR